MVAAHIGRQFRLSLVLFLGLAFLVQAAPPDDPFAPANAIDAKAAALDDPFAPANAVEVKKPAAPFAKPEGAREVGKKQKTAERLDFTIAVKPAQVRRGEIATLTITVAPKAGFYTYPMTQRTTDQNDSGLATITWSKTPGFQPLNPVRETPAPSLYDTHIAIKGQNRNEILLRYTVPVTWQQDVLVLPDAKPGMHLLRFELAVQACDAKSCVVGDHTFEAPIEVTDAPAVPLTDALKQRQAAKEDIKVVPAVPGAAVPTTKAGAKTPAGLGAVTPPPSSANQGLAAILLASMGSAFLMLLTPCVFPMIPITVSFFVKQSEKQHHRPFVMAGVYALTITIVLTGAVLILGKFIIDLANDPWMNLALGGVLIFFAFSLFGMYDIELPSFLGQWTSSREGKGGLAGTFFMALTFTITSFTCTGPFLGPLLASVSLLQIDMSTLVLAALAYSATFAAPFFFLALFPGLLKKLPKSGGWMNTVKVVMGFLELAAALKFLGNADIAFSPGNPWFFGYDAVLCAWIAISLACGMYLLGLFRLPHDEPEEHVSVPRMVLATIFLGLGLYLLPALWRATPQGLIGEALVAFLPLDTKPKGTGGFGGGAEAHLDWHLDYETAWKQAVKEDKLIFIDFTGVNCTNCRDNEGRVFGRADVRKELEKYVRVQMYNDSVPKPGLTRAEAKALAKQNQAWQEATFGDVSTPLYVVFKPSKESAFDGDKLRGTTLAQAGGKIFDNKIDAFVADVLRAPLKNAVAQATPNQTGKP